MEYCPTCLSRFMRSKQQSCPEGKLDRSIGFARLVLHHWATAYADSASAETMILFHTANLNLLVRIPAMQDIVTMYLRCKNNTSVLTPKSSFFPQAKLVSLFDKVDGLAARWHAEQILSLAEDLSTKPPAGRSSSADPSNPLAPEDRMVAEGSEYPLVAFPHQSYSISNAVLTLWCLDRLSVSTVPPGNVRHWLKCGKQLLSTPGYNSGHVGRGFSSMFIDILV